nr:MAK10-like protein [Tanacetum cinerariifolium]
MTYPVASLTLNNARSYVMQVASFIQGIVSSKPIGGSISPKGFLLPILLLVVIIFTVVIVAVILIVIVVAIVGGVIFVVIIRVVVVIDGVSSILKLLFVSLSSGDIVDLIGDEDPTDEDGDTKFSVSLAGRAVITWGGEMALYACMASIYGSPCKGSYEHYKSVGAGVELLEPGFELDDQEWVEMGSFLFVRLEMRMWIILVVPQLSWRKRKRCGHFKDQDMDYGAFKKLVGEVGGANPIHTLEDYFKPSHEGYWNTNELPIGKNVVPLRSDTILLVQNGCSFHGLRFEDPNQHLKDFLKLMDLLDFDGENRECACDLALYDNESWNDLRDFAKSVKEISLPQDVPSTSDRRLIELEHQFQHLMEAHLAPMQPTQVNKITSLCETCNGPHDNQYCMDNPKQASVEYASSHTNKVGGKWYTFKPDQNSLGDTYNPS